MAARRGNGCTQGRGRPQRKRSDWQGRRQRKEREIGSIDDFVISSDGHEVYTVTEVGGFLGVGGKKVAVPFDSLKPGNDEGQMVLPGALKKALENRPEFKDAG